MSNVRVSKIMMSCVLLTHIIMHYTAVAETRMLEVERMCTYVRLTTDELTQLQGLGVGFFLGNIWTFVRLSLAHQTLVDAFEIGGPSINGVEYNGPFAVQPRIERCARP